MLKLTKPNKKGEVNSIRTAVPQANTAAILNHQAIIRNTVFETRHIEDVHTPLEGGAP